MSESNERQKRSEPKASRPYMPGYGILDAASGRGLLPWDWATERLKKSRNYWIATTRPDGRPHLMPVWGVWLDDTFYFSTGQKSRKARNLAVNANIAVSIDLGDEAIIVEGTAEAVTDLEARKQFAAAFGEKYQWDMEGFDEPVYTVRPAVAFAFLSSTGDFTGSATRWIFDESQ